MLYNLHNNCTCEMRSSLALAVNTIAEITCLKANFNHRVIGCDVSTSVRLCKADDNYISN